MLMELQGNFSCFFCIRILVYGIIITETKKMEQKVNSFTIQNSAFLKRKTICNRPIYIENNFKQFNRCQGSDGK